PLQRRPADPHRRPQRQADQGGARMSPRSLIPLLALAVAAGIAAAQFPPAVQVAPTRPPAAPPNTPRPPPASGPDVQDLVLCLDKRPVLLRLHLYLNGKPIQAAFDDFLGKAYVYLDRNGDGVLDRDEVAKAPNALVFATFLQGQIVNFGGNPQQ